MAKVTFKGQVFTGVLVDESATHYTMEIDGDQVSFDKELTVIEAEVKKPTKQEVNAVLLEIVRAAKRNPYGQAAVKMAHFENCLELGLIPLETAAVEYKKYTTKQLKEMQQAG
jgi:hypothetical protein